MLGTQCPPSGAELELDAERRNCWKIPVPGRVTYEKTFEVGA